MAPVLAVVSTHKGPKENVSKEQKRGSQIIRLKYSCDIRKPVPAKLSCDVQSQVPMV